VGASFYARIKDGPKGAEGANFTVVDYKKCECLNSCLESNGSCSGGRYQVCAVMVHSGSAKRKRGSQPQSFFYISMASKKIVERYLDAAVMKVLDNYEEKPSVQRAKQRKFLLTDRYWSEGNQAQKGNVAKEVGWAFFKLLQKNTFGFGAGSQLPYWQRTVVNDARHGSLIHIVEKEAASTVTVLMGLKVEGPFVLHQGDVSTLYMLVRVAWVDQTKLLEIQHFDQFHCRGNDLIKQGDVLLVKNNLQLRYCSHTRNQPPVLTSQRGNAFKRKCNKKALSETFSEALSRVSKEEGLDMSRVCVDATPRDDLGEVDPSLFAVDVDRVYVAVRPCVLGAIFGQSVNITNSPARGMQNFGLNVTLCCADGKMLWALIPKSSVAAFKTQLNLGVGCSAEMKDDVALEVLKELLRLRMTKGTKSQFVPADWGTGALAKRRTRWSIQDLVSVLEKAQNAEALWSDNALETNSSFFTRRKEMHLRSADDATDACQRRLANVNWEAAALIFTDKVMLVYGVHGQKSAGEGELRDVLSWVFDPLKGSIWKHTVDCFLEVDVARQFQTFSKDGNGGTLFPQQFTVPFEGDTIALAYMSDCPGFFVRNYPIASAIQKKVGNVSGNYGGWFKAQSQSMRTNNLGKKGGFNLIKWIGYPNLHHFMQNQGIDCKSCKFDWKAVLKTLGQMDSALSMLCGTDRKARQEMSFVGGSCVNEMRVEGRVSFALPKPSVNAQTTAGADEIEILDIKHTKASLQTLFQTEEGKVGFYTDIVTAIYEQAFSGEDAKALASSVKMQALNAAVFAELGKEQVEYLRRAKCADGSYDDANLRRGGMCTLLAQCGQVNDYTLSKAHPEGMCGFLQESLSGSKDNSLHHLLQRKIDLAVLVLTEEFGASHVDWVIKGIGDMCHIHTRPQSNEKDGTDVPYTKWEREMWKNSAVKKTAKQRQIDTRGVVARARLYKHRADDSPPTKNRCPEGFKSVAISTGAGRGGHYERRGGDILKDKQAMFLEFLDDFHRAKEECCYKANTLWLDVVRWKTCKSQQCALCTALHTAESNLASLEGFLTYKGGPR
jgi:hypothetical protein